ncbi:PREDICTED: tyrosine-protein phosphatase non-receptor type substrate 1-like, partial [Buceros rhinoceros silvestris]|uniref:tyrosine-protein phosphatase non-receptor type substrate 1-like n=1 Tax=Buceros rhinoceros silvestris TaxID=175836 RepID=UPI00052931BB
VRPGQSVPFTCTAGGFFPRDISVKWLKNKHPVSAQPLKVTPGQKNSSFNMSSTVTVMLHEDDVGSRLVCEVQHPTLREPQRGTYQLREALRVRPSVRVVTDSPSRAELNKTVNFTCYVEDFYPGDVNVTWLENGTELKVENVSRPVVTPRGLFTLRSLVEVQATLERNGSTFTCRVLHNGQDRVSGTATLHVPFPAGEGLSNRFQPQNGSLRLIYIVVGVVCTVLALLVAAIVYLIWAKQGKGKETPPLRLHEPEKRSEATTQ